MIEGLVSTIIPVYNRGIMLCEAVDSVLMQSWRSVEIIIVDDGSTDETSHVAEELRERNPEVIRVLYQTNAGPGVARQAGLETSRGEFIQFLDSDDLLLPSKFEMQVQGLRDDPAAGISYGKTYTRQGGLRLPDPAKKSATRFREIFPTALTGRIWETATPLYRRSALHQIGPWSSRRQLEDWEFDCRAGAVGTKLHYCDSYVAEYVIHSENRLSHAWMTNREAMRDRLAVYVAVLAHAKLASVAREEPEMQLFARSLFWMARNAGSYGLPQEAQELFELACSQTISPGWDFKLFDFSRKLLGWRRASRLAESTGRWRK